MEQDDPDTLHALIERLGRLVASQSWATGLNPSQAAALGYLLRANRFSRGPSQVADYLGATRGTVSQTLLALDRKGLITARHHPEDQRKTSYDVTGEGRKVLAGGVVEQVLAALPAEQAWGLEAGLRAVLVGVLAARRGRAFGVCHTCRHHQAGPSGARCGLLGVDLLPDETSQICVEQEPRAA